MSTVNPTFYFIISRRPISSITGKKLAEIKSYFIVLGHEINTAEGDVTGPAAHVQIMFPLKNKKKCKICENIFPGRT